MIVTSGVTKKNVNGQEKYDFGVFRGGNKAIVGMYDELMNLVAFIKDAAQGGAANELAFVMIGEAGNGKTYLAEFLASAYRKHTTQPQNQKFTFQFVNLDDKKFNGRFGKIKSMESQTYEDPMILALNLFPDRESNKKFLLANGLPEAKIEELYEKNRPLGACSEYTLRAITDLAQSKDDISNLVKSHVRVVPVVISDNSGVLTAKIPAQDKITGSQSRLLGEQDIKRYMQMEDDNHPYLYNLRNGALARVGGGGILLADELFKNPADLIKGYLSIIQNKTLEIDGRKWPLDTFIIATSNNTEYQNFAADGENHPVLDRCHPCYVGYCTDKNEQQKLTTYVLGDAKKKSFTGEELHQDPNLVPVMSIAAVLTRFPELKGGWKLSRNDLLRLAAGESAEDKTPAMLKEIVEELEHESDFRKRFGMSGISQRGLEKAFIYLQQMSEVNEGKCLFTGAAFKALERAVLDDRNLDSNQKERFIKEEFKEAQKQYMNLVHRTIFNAYRDDPNALEQYAMNYIRMIVAMSESDQLRQDQQRFLYKNPLTGNQESLKLDMKFVNAIDKLMGLTNKEQQEASHQLTRNQYLKRLQFGDPTESFVHDQKLLKAITDYVLKSDVEGAASLAGALADRTNEANQKLYNRMIDAMLGKLDYCKSCAEGTIQLYVSSQE